MTSCDLAYRRRWRPRYDRSMLRHAAAAALLALTSCSLLLSDDLAGTPTTGGTNDASADGPGGAVAHDGGSTDGDGSNSAQATPRRPVGPLEVTVVNGISITASVKGFFEIEYTAGRNWKPSRLLDLGLPGNPNLAPSLFEPFAAMIEGQTVANSTDEEAGYFEVEDATPARFSVTTYAHQHLPSGADAKIIARWAIYASGRLIVRTSVYADGTGALALPQGWIHSSYSLDPTKKWNVVEGSDKRSATFFLQEPSGLGISALLHDSAGNLGTRSASERHWFGDAISLPSKQTITKVSELQLGVTPEEAAARVADAHSSEVGVLSGLSKVEEGYDPVSGAYKLNRLPDAAVATFELTPVQARAYPAIEIGNVGPNWRLTLDGQTVVSAMTPVTPLGVAHYASDIDRLLVVYLGTIPANASTEKRTFTLEQL